MKLQIWSPDTCKCKVEEQWDPDKLNTPFTMTQVLKKCAEHITVSDSELYGVIYANTDSEQKRKNLIEKQLLENESFGIAEEKKNPDGSSYKVFKDGITYNWSFVGEGKDRILNVEVKGVDFTANKDILKTFCDTAFKIGKVEVQ